MKTSIRTALIVGVVGFIASGCQVSPTVHGHGGVVIQDGQTRVGVMFSSGDRRHIHGYYQEHHRYYYKGKKPKGRKGLPPGLAKRDRLPPGLAKRDRLPSGLHGYRLPHELDRRLSRLPEGVIRVRIGTDIVLMDERTRVILDVVKDIPLY